MASTSATIEVQILDEELLKKVTAHKGREWVAWQELVKAGILPPVSGPLPHLLLPEDLTIWYGRAEKGGFFVTDITITDLGLKAKIGFVPDRASPGATIEWPETGLFPNLVRPNKIVRTYVSQVESVHTTVIIRP